MFYLFIYLCRFSFFHMFVYVPSKLPSSSADSTASAFTLTHNLWMWPHDSPTSLETTCSNLFLKVSYANSPSTMYIVLPLTTSLYSISGRLSLSQEFKYTHHIYMDKNKWTHTRTHISLSLSDVDNGHATSTLYTITFDVHPLILSLFPRYFSQWSVSRIILMTHCQKKKKKRNRKKNYSFSE